MRQTGEVIRSESQVSYDYATIRLTQSRLNKGLIAIPVGLSKWFPDHNADIQIYLNDSPVAQSKRYSSYNSTTKECRIGGVKQWFDENNLKSGDEIVVQVVDKRHSTYRLIPEKQFVVATQELQTNFDNAANELEASEKLTSLSEWTNVEKSGVALNEYRRLAASTSAERQLTARRASRSRESTPPNLRTVLGQLYQGHCQVCDFWFLKRNNDPYFEIHHLDPRRGHHPKNLLVVCGNCHNQFEHADVVSEFDDEEWLIRVRFNRILHQVNQITLTGGMPNFSKELFV